MSTYKVNIQLGLNNKNFGKTYTYVFTYMDCNDNFMFEWSNKYLLMTSLIVLRKANEELTKDLWKLKRIGLSK